MRKHKPRSSLSPEKLEKLRKYRRESQKNRYWCDPIYRELVKDRANKYHSKNREQCKQKLKDRYWNNREKHLRSCLEYKNRKYRNDDKFRITERLRFRLRQALRSQKIIKSNGALQLLGCSIPDFRIYLESRFEPGMTWENYGYRGWHIDHIIPCALFDLSNPDHQKRCFHFSNLQPMWAFDNMRKSKNSRDNQFRLL